MKKPVKSKSSLLRFVTLRTPEDPKDVLHLSECCNEELTNDFKCGHCKQDCESYQTESELN